MSYSVDLDRAVLPLKIEARIRTQEEYEEFVRVLAKKWNEYVTPSTVTFSGARSN